MEMFADLNLEPRQKSQLVFVFVHDLEERESQHASGTGLPKCIELLLQDSADAVEMIRYWTRRPVHHLAELLLQPLAFPMVR